MAGVVPSQLAYKNSDESVLCVLRLCHWVVRPVSDSSLWLVDGEPCRSHLHANAFPHRRLSLLLDRDRHRPTSKASALLGSFHAVAHGDFSAWILRSHFDDEHGPVTGTGVVFNCSATMGH